MISSKALCEGRAVWPLVLTGLLLTVMATALEYEGVPGQWTRYGRWEAKVTGELSFTLKTNISKALVLYLDDGGNCDFLELLITDGRLHLRFTIHCAEPASLHTETHVNDQRWHRVLLTRNYRATTLVVDNEEKVAEVKSKRSEMVVASDLYVGGISPDVRLSALTSSTVKYEPPFQGLIANLKLGENLPVLLDGQSVQNDLEYLCIKQNPCSNRGLCSIHQGEVLCDCTNTGYKGNYCHEAIQKAEEGAGCDAEGYTQTPHGMMMRMSGRLQFKRVRFQPLPLITLNSPCDEQGCYDHAHSKRRALLNDMLQRESIRVFIGLKL